ncbi:MAG: hypothetical protein L6Q80_04305 [Dehalococcoidia bacterium]|nr:hypothetical protein [Dehalococcoidia bacterium]
MRLLIITGLVLALAGALLACNEKEPAGDDSDAPISATPAPPSVSDRSLLHEARLDAAGARRLNTGPLNVELVSLRQAGMGKFVGPVDPAMSAVSDGSPVPPEMETDFNAVLALYTRHDFTLRTRQNVAAIVVRAIVPVAFPNACAGWERPGVACDQVITPGAIVLLSTPGDKTYRYHVSGNGIIATDFTPGRATVEPEPAPIDLQQRLREDLAGRTGVAIEKVSLYSFREVTWPNGCLGIERPGAVCTQALVDGFLATLSDDTGKEYRYHGADDRFIAASFEQGATLSGPLPRKP